MKYARIYFREGCSDDVVYLGYVKHNEVEGEISITMVTSLADHTSSERADFITSYLMQEFSEDNLLFKFGRDALKDEGLLEKACQYHTNEVFMKIDT